MAKKILIIVSSVVLVFASLTTTQPKIFVIGDSTACVYNSSLYPLTGWAQVLPGFLNMDSTEVADSARSGCSSKSYYTEGRWTPIKNALRKGDYVVIEFGHNDEKTDSKSTNAETTYKQYLSIYIDDAISKGAIPILATPIERDYWNRDNLTLQKTHVTSDSGDFPAAMRELAIAKNVTLVDMTALTKAYFEKVGKDSTDKLFMIFAKNVFANYPSGYNDQTHLQERGAKTIAQLFINDVNRQKLSPFYSWVKGSFATSNKPVKSKHQVSTGNLSFVRNNTVYINEKLNLVSFTLCDLNGRILISKNVSTASRTIPLNDRDGAELASGKYELRYRLSDGSMKSLQIVKK
jgi:lysophospholipase L1-like esterase